MASKAHKFFFLLPCMKLWGILGYTLILTARNSAHWRKCLGIGIIGYKMLKTLWEPGFVLLRGSESVGSFTPFHLFIDWSGTWLLLAWCWCCCLGLFACSLCCVGSCPFILSSCLTMTTLAQLHDCHSCNDERSIVQKKHLVMTSLKWNKNVQLAAIEATKQNQTKRFPTLRLCKKRAGRFSAASQVGGQSLFNKVNAKD